MGLKGKLSPILLAALAMICVAGLYFWWIGHSNPTRIISLPNAPVADISQPPGVSNMYGVGIITYSPDRRHVLYKHPSHRRFYVYDVVADKGYTLKRTLFLYAPYEGDLNRGEGKYNEDNYSWTPDNKYVFIDLVKDIITEENTVDRSVVAINENGEPKILEDGQYETLLAKYPNRIGNLPEYKGKCNPEISSAKYTELYNRIIEIGSSKNIISPEQRSKDDYRRNCPVFNAGLTKLWVTDGGEIIEYDLKNKSTRRIDVYSEDNVAAIESLSVAPNEQVFSFVVQKKGFGYPDFGTVPVWYLYDTTKPRNNLIKIQGMQNNYTESSVWLPNERAFIASYQSGKIVKVTY